MNSTKCWGSTQVLRKSELRCSGRVNSGAPEESTQVLRKSQLRCSGRVNCFCSTNRTSCYSGYKPSDKSWMMRGTGCIYERQNIHVSFVICDTDMWILHRNQIGTFGSVAAFLSTTLYQLQGHHDRNYNFKIYRLFLLTSNYFCSI